MAIKRQSLGKGLDALLSTSNKSSKKKEEQLNKTNQTKVEKSIELTEKTKLQKDLKTQDDFERIHFISTLKLQRGKYQPRVGMNEDKLTNLSASIKTQGIIQPLVIRKILNSDHFEIVAGERRWQAAKIAGLKNVPCLIKEENDEKIATISLIENIQREDLNAIEQAQAINKLINEFNLTHEKIAISLGKSRAFVSNTLRLLTLTLEVQKLLELGDIDMGHARALLGVIKNRQLEIALLVIEKKLSVRETEKLVNGLNEKKSEKSISKKEKSHLILDLEKDLSKNLGLTVTMQEKTKNKGVISINYKSKEELEALLEKINK